MSVSQSEYDFTKHVAKSDCVFTKDGESIVGIIKRINHKTVALETSSGHQWRVAYSFLYRVHDIKIFMNALQNET